MTSHLMFFSWIRSKPGIEIGYLVSLGKVFEEIFLGEMFSVFLNKLLHNTILLRIFGDAPEFLNGLIVVHDGPCIGEFQRRGATTA